MKPVTWSEAEPSPKEVAWVLFLFLVRPYWNKVLVPAIQTSALNYFSWELFLYEEAGLLPGNSKSLSTICPMPPVAHQPSLRSSLFPEAAETIIVS